MDYLKQSVLFKVKKVLRYVRLYGVRRTYMKVRGQLHLRKRYEVLPEPTRTFGDDRCVAIIGAGNFAYTTIAYFLRKRLGNVVGACMDKDIHRAASLANSYRIPFYSTNADHIMSDDRIRLVYISSYHSSHAEYAIDALNAGKHVYIEKPHAVTEDQLSRLVTAMSNSEGKVFIGFNRPLSRFGAEIANYLGRESGPAMYNWFIGGHDLEPDHWYHNSGEGGRVLGNLCHWTDFILRLVPPQDAYPIVIRPTRFEEPDVNIAVTYTFGDGSIAAITFAAKGHAFEGVKERFTGYRGNCLVTMDDFKTMTIDIVDRKKQYTNLFRDHGHEASIVSAAQNVMRNQSYDRQANLAYVWNTGWLVLKTRQALEENREITVGGFNDNQLYGRNNKYEATTAV